MRYLSVRLRWNYSAQIFFLTLSLLFLFLTGAAHAEPTKHPKTHEALAVIMAAGFTDLQGPIEYRPQAGGQKTERATKFLQTASLDVRDIAYQGAANSAAYSGNRAAENAKP